MFGQDILSLRHVLSHMKLDLMGYVRSDSGSLKSDTIHNRYMEGQSGQREHFLILINHFHFLILINHFHFLILINHSFRLINYLSILINHFLILINHGIY